MRSMSRAKSMHLGRGQSSCAYIMRSLIQSLTLEYMLGKTIPGLKLGVWHVVQMFCHLTLSCWVVHFEPANDVG